MIFTIFIYVKYEYRIVKWSVVRTMVVSVGVCKRMLDNTYSHNTVTIAVKLRKRNSDAVIARSCNVKCTVWFKECNVRRTLYDLKSALY